MKVIDIVLGLIVLLMGIWQYIMSVEAVKKIFSFIGEPGSTVFNGILIVVGLILIIYGLRRPVVMMRR